MSGYYFFSKSNNAIYAEENGRFSASRLARRIGVKSKAIKALMEPCEWHHTSKHFNETDYYDETEALEMIEELKAWKEPPKDVVIHENCSCEHLEWSGTRNHPYAKEIRSENVRATAKGDWFLLEFPDGRTLRKRKNTNGFILRNHDGRRINW